MFGIRFWCLSVVYTLGSALFLGLPTVLIPNSLFSRSVPTGLLDYVIWGVSALLIGPLMALATLHPVEATVSHADRSLGGSGRVFAGALLSFFSVGCPVCNKIVVLLLGLSGAMTVFNPLRPFLGLASIMLLGVTLFLRVRVLSHGCRVSLKQRS